MQGTSDSKLAALTEITGNFRLNWPMGVYTQALEKLHARFEDRSTERL